MEVVLGQLEFKENRKGSGNGTQNGNLQNHCYSLYLACSYRTLYQVRQCVSLAPTNITPLAPTSMFTISPEKANPVGYVQFDQHEPF